MVRVTIRGLPASAMAISEPATSMSLGLRPGTETGFAPSGSEGAKWSTFSFAPNHICPSGPATIGLLLSASRTVNASLKLGFDGENEATLFVAVTQIFPSGPAAIPEGFSISLSSNSSTWPAGVTRATSLFTPCTASQMFPSGPAAILVLVSTADASGN